MRQYNIIDLFAGVGGLSYGFSRLPQFNIIAANEIEEDISAAYKLNHPDVKMLNCDIKDLTAEMIYDAVGDNKIDIVVGGPPCQSYSTLGKRRMDEKDPANKVCHIARWRTFSVTIPTGRTSGGRGPTGPHPLP